jgi:hypothetical protein
MKLNSGGQSGNGKQKKDVLSANLKQKSIFFIRKITFFGKDIISLIYFPAHIFYILEKTIFR